MATRSSSCSLCCVSSDLDQNPLSLSPYLFSSVSAASTWWVFQSHYASFVLLLLVLLLHFFPLLLLIYREYLFPRSSSFLRLTRSPKATRREKERRSEKESCRLPLNLYRDIFVFSLSLSPSFFLLRSFDFTVVCSLQVTRVVYREQYHASALCTRKIPRNRTPRANRPRTNHGDTREKRTRVYISVMCGLEGAIRFPSMLYSGNAGTRW